MWVRELMAQADGTFLTTGASLLSPLQSWILRRLSRLGSHPAALRRGRTYLRQRWNCPGAPPGASWTSRSITAGTGRAGRGSLLPGLPLPAAARALPALRLVSRVTSSNRVRRPSPGRTK